MYQPNIPFFRTLKHTIQLHTTQKHLRRQNWNFGRDRTDLLLNELQDWRQNYLPFDVKGKTVLDVGAGKGESAYFYLANGAKQVIAIEPVAENFRYLRENAKHHNIVPLNKFFELTDLSAYRFDFAKIDIEGWEEMLLDIDPVKPMVVEVHGNQLMNKFIKKGYAYKKLNDIAGCCNYAYWLPS